MSRLWDVSIYNTMQDQDGTWRWDMPPSNQDLDDEHLVDLILPFLFDGYVLVNYNSSLGSVQPSDRSGQAGPDRWWIRFRRQA